jgi:three-Cys-motif partner protein|tara:strand:- start:612 stop:1736 length:1125 start_codon:yes stop_codon:yes gene_type:complete
VKGDKFFDETLEQSVVKGAIVEKYFGAWSRIITGTQLRYKEQPQKIGYVDLFAGPGRYKDGAISTPLRVLNAALEYEKIHDRLITIFNDKDDAHVRTLSEAIAELEEVKKLKHPPEIWNEEVGDNIAAQFERMNIIPVLAFIDPWGYKGMSLRLVNAFLKDWGCDCLFFFNYARINAGLNNPKVRAHMEALFENQTQPLISSLEGLKPDEREAMIIEKLAEALKSYGHRFVLPFCFKNSSGKRTTHHLIFVTKHFKGYEVMKDIMAKASSFEEQGVASFQYMPATAMSQGLLFALNQPISSLKSSLAQDFGGRTITMRDIYEQHSVDTPFTSNNYKVALKEMEEEGAISTIGRKSSRGFADHIQCVFPQTSPSE